MLTNTWTKEAIRKIEADFNRTADTHLFKLNLEKFPDIELYFKDESTHPTGSLKHRLARSLFLYGICNGWINATTTIIEASSGSTAVSEAYFAKMLGLPFIAVMPASTSHEKILKISFYGGKIHLVAHASEVCGESQRLAKELKGHFMDQFTYAERATDWRGSNNIAESIFQQLSKESHPVPTWIVVGAGTGGTSATLGRYVRYRSYDTKICVVDPENSVFYPYYQSRDPSLSIPADSKVEGIGRPRVETSFLPEVIDRMIQIPDAASFAAIRYLETLIGKKCGGSTGTGFCGLLQLVKEMSEKGEKGSLVALICDAGERYLDTYYDDSWLQKNGYSIYPYIKQMDDFISSGSGRLFP